MLVTRGHPPLAVLDKRLQHPAEGTDAETDTGSVFQAGATKARKSADTGKLNKVEAGAVVPWTVVPRTAPADVTTATTTTTAATTTAAATTATTATAATAATTTTTTTTTTTIAVSANTTATTTTVGATVSTSSTSAIPGPSRAPSQRARTTPAWHTLHNHREHPCVALAPLAPARQVRGRAVHAHNGSVHHVVRAGGLHLRCATKEHPPVFALHKRRRASCKGEDKDGGE
jgi:uncharacterized protein with beta-barrel porin domain